MHLRKIIYRLGRHIIPIKTYQHVTKPAIKDDTDAALGSFQQIRGDIQLDNDADGVLEPLLRLQISSYIPAVSLTLPASPRSRMSVDSMLVGSPAETPVEDIEPHTQVTSGSVTASSGEADGASLFMTNTSGAPDGEPDTAVIPAPVASADPSVPASGPTSSPSPDAATDSSQDIHLNKSFSQDAVTMNHSTSDLPSVISPPPEQLEPDIPAFLVDDPDDPLSDEDNTQRQDLDLIKSQEISLTNQPSTTTSPAPLPLSPNTHVLGPLTPNFQKDVPPPPETEEGEDIPDMYLPGLVLPTMFLPIPNTDPLTTLLTKYVSPELRPARDTSGEWQNADFHTLVMSNRWRALACMARDRLVTTNPEEIQLILNLWYLRLSSLSRLRLFNQTSAECTNLYTVLHAIEPASARTYVFERLLPFELGVLHARLKYWAGDHLGYLDALSAMFRTCKSKAKTGDDQGRAMWKERGARICLITASQLIEMKDFSAAANLLEPLCAEEGGSAHALRSAIARIYLQGGHLGMAAKHFAIVDLDPEVDERIKRMNAALQASARGDWSRAAESLGQILDSDPSDSVAVNNLAVALLSQGKLNEAIDIIEKPLKTSPSTVVVAEPYLFNLSTLYELRSATATEKKRNLLIEVAKWSGDGLKTACLKMPTN